MRPTLFAIVLAALASISCDSSSKPGGSKSAPGEVVVYCSVDTAFGEPILDAYAAKAGIKVHKVFDTEAGKTTGLVNRLLAERERPRADVWWSSEIFGTMQLAAAGALEAYKPASAGDIPSRYRDAAGLWTAFGLRGRVIAYDPARTKQEDLPRRWADLAQPRYKGRFRMADPRFGTTRGHMATLLTLWGDGAMTEFYRGLKANGCVLTDGNSQSVLHMTRGLCDFAATDTDDVVSARLQGISIEMVYPDLDAPGGGTKTPGTLWIPCSTALVKGAPHADAGRRLIEYLASAELEEKLHASDSRNVPVRNALREKLKVTAPGEALIDYRSVAGQLEKSDQLVNNVLLK